MEDVNLSEPTWKRALGESEAFRQSSPRWYWGPGLIGPSLFTSLGAWEGVKHLPEVPTDAQSFWIPFAGGVAGLVIGVGAAFLLIVLWNLMRAPYRQRNEARHHVAKLEGELNKPNLFDVIWQTKSMGLPINQMQDGTFRAASAGIGPSPIRLVHRGDLTKITRITMLPVARFVLADNSNWQTTHAIEVSPMPAMPPLAKAGELDFSWDTTSGDQWVLDGLGLPLTMGKDETLMLPNITLSVADAQEAGTHFEKGDRCELIFRIGIRTDKGSVAVPDQAMKLTMSNAMATTLSDIVTSPKPTTNDSEVE